LTAKFYGFTERDVERDNYCRVEDKKDRLGTGGLTTAELGFAVQPKRKAKAEICSEKSLPCVRARQRLLGKDLDGKAVFAVRQAKIARQSLCRAG
jgi:hypothetical protein